MTTYTWTVGASGLWSVNTNWTPIGVPSTGDTAMVTLPGAYLISEPGTVSVVTLVLDDAAGEITVGGSLSVSGAMTIDAGTVAISGTLNAGSLTNAGTFTNTSTIFATNLINTGTIHNNGTGGSPSYLALNGTVDVASLERIDGSGGFLAINAVVRNAGGTLDGAFLATQTVLTVGAIEGGTVENLTTAASAGFSNLPASKPLLDGVTWLGELSLDNSLVRIQNGLTMTGTTGASPGTLSLGSGGRPGTVEFVGDQTFDNAIVSDYGTIIADNTLTFGGGVVYDQVQSILFGSDPLLDFAGASVILNHGTIIGIAARYDMPSGFNNSSMNFAPVEFHNFGIVDARDSSLPGSNPGTGLLHVGFYEPGSSIASFTAATLVNEAGGTIATGQSGGIGLLTIAASTNFTNDGIMLTEDASSVAGGTIDIAAILSGGGTVEVNGGGLVHLRGATSGTQNIDFTGAGTLTLDTPAFDPAIINGFTNADTIFGVAATGISYTSEDLKLQVTGGQTIDLGITGSHALGDFSIVANAGTTAITVCFATGTRLATTRGMVTVETLRETDEMLPAEGAARPVVWIGHREIDCRRHPEPHQVWPVRISAGAFADNVPVRDLYLSPDHAMFVNGVLIPVKYLINGHTVTQCPVSRVEYWHVELASHEVIVAEGLSVGSLLPGSGRAFFGNGGAAIDLYPRHTGGNWEMQGYAPLVVVGPSLQTVREMLASRSVRCQRAA